MSNVTQLEFSPPSRNSKGFLRRMKQMLSFAAASKTGEASPEQLEGMVNFLAQYVINDIPMEEKVDAIWDLSEDQFTQLMQLVQVGQEGLDGVEGNETAG